MYYVAIFLGIPYHSLRSHKQLQPSLWVVKKFAAARWWVAQNAVYGWMGWFLNYQNIAIKYYRMWFSVGLFVLAFSVWRKYFLTSFTQGIFWNSARRLTTVITRTKEKMVFLQKSSNFKFRRLLNQLGLAKKNRIYLVAKR